MGFCGSDAVSFHDVGPEMNVKPAAASRWIEREPQRAFMTSASKPSPPSGLRGALACRNLPIVYLNMPESGANKCKNVLYRVDRGVNHPDPAAIGNDMGAFLRPQGKRRAAFDRALRTRKISFTFVKQPFSRCLDAFNERIVLNNRHGFPRMRDYVALEFGADFASQAETATPERYSDNFAAFLHFLHANREGKTGAFPPSQPWLTQKSILDKYREDCAVDFIGRVEKFRLGMRYVLDMAGREGEIDFGGALGDTPRPAFSLDQIMTDEIHAKLHQLYDVDLAEFGYRCPRCHHAGRPDLQTPKSERRPPATVATI